MQRVIDVPVLGADKYPLAWQWQGVLGIVRAGDGGCPYLGESPPDRFAKAKEHLSE
jgi:hypothetical protein